MFGKTTLKFYLFDFMFEYFKISINWAYLVKREEVGFFDMDRCYRDDIGMR